jgi:hypothetical protein
VSRRWEAEQGERERGSRASEERLRDRERDRQVGREGDKKARAGSVVGMKERYGR